MSEHGGFDDSPPLMVHGDGSTARSSNEAPTVEDVVEQSPFGSVHHSRSASPKNDEEDNMIFLDCTKIAEPRVAFHNMRQSPSFHSPFGAVPPNPPSSSSFDSAAAEPSPDAGGLSGLLGFLLAAAVSEGSGLGGLDLSTFLHPSTRLSSSQVELSRRDAFDGVNWPPEDIFASTDLPFPCNKQNRDEILEFLSAGEVSLRRMAQLAEQDFMERARLRFCTGGIDKEREDCRSFIAFTASGPRVYISEAVETLWSGARGAALRECADVRSWLAMRAIMEMVWGMDERCPRNGADTLADIHLAVKHLRNSCTSDKLEAYQVAVASLPTLIEALDDFRARRIVGAKQRLIVPTDEGTPVAEAIKGLVDLGAGGLHVLDAMGFKESMHEGVFEVSRLSSDLRVILAYAQEVTAVKGDLSRLELSTFQSRCKGPVLNNQPDFISVYSPESRVYHVGGVLTVKWYSFGRLKKNRVRLKLVQGDFSREAVLTPDGTTVPRYLRFIHSLTGPIVNTGQFVWVIPDSATIPPGDHYKIVVQDESGAASDQSFPFQIAAGPPPPEPVFDEPEQEYLTYADLDYNEQQYGQYIKSKLARCERPLQRSNRNAPPIQVRLRSGEYHENISQHVPTQGMVGTLVAFTRFAPEVCVRWQDPRGQRQAFEYWVHWHNIEVVPSSYSSTPQAEAHPHGSAWASYTDPATAKSQHRHVGDSSKTTKGTRTRNKRVPDAFKCKIHPEGHSVFLSYRRGDGQDLARVFYLQLQRLGYSVFFDRECLTGGDFIKQLTEWAKSTPVLLPIITKGYLDKKRVNEDPKDFCRIEFLTALEAQCAFLPVIAEDYARAWNQDLGEITEPKMVEVLSRYNAVTFNSEFFEATLARVKRMLDDLLQDIDQDPISPTSELDDETLNEFGHGAPGAAQTSASQSTSIRMPSYGPTHSHTTHSTATPRASNSAANIPHVLPTPTSPAVEVVAPSGTVVLGQPTKIVWESTGTFLVDIQLFVSHTERTSRYLQDIAKKVNSTAGYNSFSWVVPLSLTVGEEYRVFVRPVLFPNGADQSDAIYPVKPAEPRDSNTSANNPTVPSPKPSNRAGTGGPAAQAPAANPQPGTATDARPTGTAHNKEHFQGATGGLRGPYSPHIERASFSAGDTVSSRKSDAPEDHLQSKSRRTPSVIPQLLLAMVLILSLLYHIKCILAHSAEMSSLLVMHLFPLAKTLPCHLMWQLRTM